MTVRVPKWALIALGVVVVAIAAFLIGRGGDGDEGGDGGGGSGAVTDGTGEVDPIRTIALDPKGDRVARIGELDVNAANLDDARTVFGPESLRGGGGDTCEVEWGELGLEIVFANFGGADSCGPEGAVASASIGGEEGAEEGWATENGLALGDEEAELRKLYPRAKESRFPPSPDAKYEGERLVLASTYTPFGEGGDTPTVTAVVADGELAAFEIYVGAAGE